MPGRGAAPPARTGERRARAEGRGRRGPSGGDPSRRTRSWGRLGCAWGGGFAVPCRAGRGLSGLEGPGSGTPSVLPPCPRRRPRLSRPGSPASRAATARPGSAPTPPSPPAIPAFALSGRLAPRPSRARGRAPGMRAPAAARGTPRRRPPLRASPPGCGRAALRAPSPRWSGSTGLSGEGAASSAARGRCVGSRVACRGLGRGWGARAGGRGRPPCSDPPPPACPARARPPRSPRACARVPRPPWPSSPPPSSKPGRAPACAAGSCSPPAPRLSPSGGPETGRALTAAFPCRGPPTARASPRPLPASRPSRPWRPPRRDLRSDVATR